MLGVGKEEGDQGGVRRDNKEGGEGKGVEREENVSDRKRQTIKEE